VKRAVRIFAVTVVFNPFKTSAHYARGFVYIQLELAFMLSVPEPAVAFTANLLQPTNCYSSPPLLRAITASLAAQSRHSAIP
jgi:hypothetical protein